MTLEQINWATLTQAESRRLIGPALRREEAAAERWDKSDEPEDESAWLAAFTLWEDLRVYAICGEKPS